MGSDAPTFLSLFAGIGGFDFALEKAGWRGAGQVELDSFCQRVLTARWPGITRAADVRSSFTASMPRIAGDDRRSRVDLLVGGFPCQDFSVAGKRAGLTGYRGTLFWEIVRIAKAIQPPWGLFENVPGLLSSHRGRDFWAVLQGLRECWPAVGWRILDSRHFGVLQRRRRVFFVCGPSEAAVASVLFEPEGGGGDSPAGREAGARVAASLTGGSHRPGVSYPGRRKEEDENLIFATLNSGGNEGGFRTEPGEHLVVDPLTSKPYADNEAQHRRLVVGPLRSNPYNNSDPTMEVQQLVHGLPSEGADASEGYPAARIGAVVRRLTPMECERLQAFPDGWTCLCQPLDAYAADPEQAAWNCTCPDGPRYRALGNAVTVSVIEWIGRRLRGTHG